MDKDTTPQDVLSVQKEILEIQKEIHKMAKEQIVMAKQRNEMSAERSKMSLDRSEMSAQRSYMNNERTLSVWVRTALSAMIFGIAIDRFGLMIEGISSHREPVFSMMNLSTTVVGAALMILSVLMALSAVWRFLLFNKSYKKEYKPPYNYNAWLPAIYAFMVAIFGMGMFVFMWFVV